MNRDQKIAAGIFSVTALLTAGIAMIVVRNREEIHQKLIEIKKDFAAESRSRMDGMTEEVAMKTAKLTHNPKINQEWVEHQWEMVQ